MNGIELDTLLRSYAEPGYRDLTIKLTPGLENNLGVRIPTLRKIAKGICKEDWRGFLEYPSRSYEHTLVKSMVIGTAPMDIDERLYYTDRFVPEITNWAINDTFCCSWKINCGDDPEKLWRYCLELIDRHEEYPSRLGTVLILCNFLDDDHIDMVNDILVSCPRCGYYLDMGIAWTLSYCFIKYPERTEKVIFDGRLEKDVLRMTVRKICESFRVDPKDKERLKRRLKGC